MPNDGFYPYSNFYPSEMAENSNRYGDPTQYYNYNMQSNFDPDHYQREYYMRQGYEMNPNNNYYDRYFPQEECETLPILLPSSCTCICTS